MMGLPLEPWEVVARLVAATLLSALIGFEREIRNKPAGLRTHMLVGLGSAAFCVFTLSCAGLATSPDSSIKIDPTRTIAGIAGGLGFLGGGAIIQSRGDVYGLTTAAGIWIAGAIGIGCGIGNYFAVGLTTVIAITCLVPVGMFERHLDKRVKPDVGQGDD